jgi:hypothetical protein
MRERLRLSDLHVMFVCLDGHYGPLARRALADAATFRNTGGNALLVCPPGSPLDQLAERQDIPRYPLEGGSDWRSLWALYQLARQLVAQQGLDLVHCYQYRALLALGAALKREAKIPLVYTCNEDLVLAYAPFWHDWFVTRTDQVLTFAPTLAEQVAGVLPLGPRKVASTGAGIDRPRVGGRPWGGGGGRRVATFLPSDATTTDRLWPLLAALAGLTAAAGENVVLELVSDKSWYDHPLYPALKHAVLERGLEHQMAFHPLTVTDGGLCGQDIFVAPESADPFDDVEVRAILMGIPVLLPRTPARTELLDGGKLGLTYAGGDVRELRAKALEILSRRPEFVKSLGTVHASLWESHQSDTYCENLFQTYERLVLQRLRFALRRRSPFAS